MLTKNELKYYSLLLNKKHRSAEKKFIVEGEKLVLEGLNSGYICDIVCITKEFADSRSQSLKNFNFAGIRKEIIKEAEIKKLTDTKTPQGITAVFQFKEMRKKISDGRKIIVALEKINDPGNLGTIIRTCDWFGVKDILLSTNCAELYNPKVIRSTMGSIFHLDIFPQTNFSILFDDLKADGYQILIADLQGENLFEFNTTKPSVIVFSNESHGPSEETLHYADKIISIPKIGSAESLNVASAAAVILSRLTH